MTTRQEFSTPLANKYSSTHDDYDDIHDSGFIQANMNQRNLKDRNKQRTPAVYNKSNNKLKDKGVLGVRSYKNNSKDTSIKKNLNVQGSSYYFRANTNTNLTENSRDNNIFGNEVLRDISHQLSPTLANDKKKKNRGDGVYQQCKSAKNN